MAVTGQAPLPMGFSRQEYWSGLPFPSPGDLPNPGIEPPSFESPEKVGRFFFLLPPEPPGKPQVMRGRNRHGQGEHGMLG